MALSGNKTYKRPPSNLVQLSDRDRSPLGSLPESGLHNLCLHTTSDRQLTILPSTIRNLLSCWEKKKPGSRAQIASASSVSLPKQEACPQPAQLCSQLLLGPGSPFYPHSSPHRPLPRLPSARIPATVWRPEDPTPPPGSVPGLLCVLEPVILPLRPPEGLSVLPGWCRAPVSCARG